MTLREGAKRVSLLRLQLKANLLILLISTIAKHLHEIFSDQELKVGIFMLEPHKSQRLVDVV